MVGRWSGVCGRKQIQNYYYTRLLFIVPHSASIYFAFTLSLFCFCFYFKLLIMLQLILLQLILLQLMVVPHHIVTRQISYVRFFETAFFRAL